VTDIEPHGATAWTDSTPASAQVPTCHFTRVFAANDCEVISAD